MRLYYHLNDLTPGPELSLFACPDSGLNFVSSFARNWLKQDTVLMHFFFPIPVFIFTKNMKHSLEPRPPNSIHHRRCEGLASRPVVHFHICAIYLAN